MTKSPDLVRVCGRFEPCQLAVAGRSEGGTHGLAASSPPGISKPLKARPLKTIGYIHVTICLTNFPASTKLTLTMDTLPLNHTKWSDRLAFDIALTLEGSGETLTEVTVRHNITTQDILAFNRDPIFLKRVDSYREEIRDKGLTFRLKARAQSEELLTTSWLLIHDPSVSAAVKADLIKSTVKWAGLEPKNTENDGGNNAGGVKITINLGGQQVETAIIEHQAPELEEKDVTDAEYSE